MNMWLVHGGGYVYIFFQLLVCAGARKAEPYSVVH